MSGVDQAQNGNGTTFKRCFDSRGNHDNFIRRAFDKDLEEWGGRRIRFHDFRHTATTLLINTGVDIKTVKEICGHSNIATTMNYAHLLSGSVEKVSLNFVIAPKKGGEN